jgi:hypothetical protein
MFLAKVTGSIVATQKVDSMSGQKLLVVEPFRLDPETHTKLVTTGRSFVTVDTLGAGVGDGADHPRVERPLHPGNQRIAHRYRDHRHRRPRRRRRHMRVQQRQGLAVDPVSAAAPTAARRFGHAWPPPPLDLRHSPTTAIRPEPTTSLRNNFAMTPDETLIRNVVRRCCCSEALPKSP